MVDIQEDIRIALHQKRDIMKNFDKGNAAQNSLHRDSDFINPTEKIDEALSIQIWQVFGQYIAKTLKAGKAIAVPKFGIFTFTFPNHLQMAGLTNPKQRDPQIRTPVFIVGKDFISGVAMRSAIANSWAHDVYMKDSASQASSSDLILFKINKLTKIKLIYLFSLR